MKALKTAKELKKYRLLAVQARRETDLRRDALAAATAIAPIGHGTRSLLVDAEVFLAWLRGENL